MSKLNHKSNKLKQKVIRQFIVAAYLGLKEKKILPKVIMREIIYFAYAHEIIKNAETGSTIYLIKNNFIIKPPRTAILSAINKNNIDLVDFWISKGQRIEKKHFTACVERDNLEIFKLLRTHKQSDYSLEVLSTKHGKIFDYLCLTDIEYLLRDKSCVSRAKDILAINNKYTYELIKKAMFLDKDHVMDSIISEHGALLKNEEAHELAVHLYHSTINNRWKLLELILSKCKINGEEFLPGLLLHERYESAEKILKQGVKFITISRSLALNKYNNVLEILTLLGKCKYNIFNTDFDDIELAIILGTRINSEKIDSKYFYLAVQIGTFENFKYITNKLSREELMNLVTNSRINISVNKYDYLVSILR